MSSIQSVNSQNTVFPTQTRPVSNSEPPKVVAQTVEMRSDAVSIRTGILPTFKGGGLGLLAGAGGGMGVAFAINAATHMGSGALALMAIPMVGAPAGLVAGAVAANITDNKTKGAMVGAGVGALIGGAAGLLFTGGNVKLAFMSAGVGAAFGSVGGIAGASVAKHN